MLSGLQQAAEAAKKEVDAGKKTAPKQARGKSAYIFFTADKRTSVKGDALLVAQLNIQLYCHI